MGRFVISVFQPCILPISVLKDVTYMLVAKGASLRLLKNDAYPPIWKRKTKPSRLARSGVARLFKLGGTSFDGR